MSKDNSISFGVGLLFGVIAGVLSGVLLSPKPGEEIRKDLKDAVNCCLKDKEDDIDNCKTVSIDMINKMKFTIEKQISKIYDAVKAGKMAAAKRKEEIESGYNY